MIKEYIDFSDVSSAISLEDICDPPKALDVFNLSEKFTNLTFELCKTYYDGEDLDSVLIYIYDHPIICFCEGMLSGESGISDFHSSFSESINYFRKSHSWVYGSNTLITELSEIESVLYRYCSIVGIKPNCNAADFIMNF